MGIRVRLVVAVVVVVKTVTIFFRIIIVIAFIFEIYFAYFWLIILQDDFANKFPEQNEKSFKCQVFIMQQQQQ